MDGLWLVNVCRHFRWLYCEQKPLGLTSCSVRAVDLLFLSNSVFLSIWIWFECCLYNWPLSLWAAWLLKQMGPQVFVVTDNIGPYCCKHKVKTSNKQQLRLCHQECRWVLIRWLFDCLDKSISCPETSHVEELQHVSLSSSFAFHTRVFYPCEMGPEGLERVKTRLGKLSWEDKRCGNPLFSYGGKLHHRGMLEPGGTGKYLPTCW